MKKLTVGGWQLTVGGGQIHFLLQTANCKPQTTEYSA